MKKKLLLIILSVFCLNAINAEITWKLTDDGTLTISGTGDMEDYTSSGISAPWKTQKDKIKKVIIKNGVTRIGNFAFDACGLSSISIPNSVTSIGIGVFRDCIALTSIIIPNSVKTIDKGAFYQCSTLNYVSIPNSITNIIDYAFYGCSGLTSIAIPENVTSIGSSAFENCSSLTSITIPNSVTKIKNKAFYGCSNLKKVINNSSLVLSKNSDNGCVAYYAIAIYNNVCIDGKFWIYKDNNGNNWVCDYFGSDKNITLPNDIYGIVGYAFDGRSDLVSVTIPNGVVNISSYAFSGCKLQTLIIGTDISNIGEKLFGDYPYPTKTIWLPNTPPSGYANVAGNINYVSNDNYSYIQNVKVYKHLSSIFEVDGIKYVPVSPSERTCDAIDCNYDKAIENIKINDVVSYKNIGMTVLNINPYTCYGNEFIKTLNINNSGKIDVRAFEGCKNITGVTLGNNVTGIGDYAFYGCIAIKDIKIPDCVTSVGKYGFGGCSALQSLVIGKGLTSVGDYSFSGCRLLNKVVFGDCPTTIGANAFKDCSSLTELNLGKKVTTIGNYTFANCSSLAKISIPKTTTSIGNYAFSGCKALADVTIEDRTEKYLLVQMGLHHYLQIPQ